MTYFLDEFIEKIESLNLVFGGSSDPDTGIHKGCVSFAEEKESDYEYIVEERLRELQRWIINHRFSPVILLLAKSQRLRDSFGETF